jgi:hypothetical protein
MKRKAGFLPILALLLTSICVHAETHLFILSGQAFGKENVIVIKEAKGGQPISLWYEGNATGEGKTEVFYKNILTKVEAATAGKTIKTITFVWMQGERDAKTGTHNAYSDNLKGLIAKLRADLKHKEMNVVIGRLSDFDNKNPNWISVRETQVKVAEGDPRGAWVDTDDLNNLPNKDGGTRDDLHLSKEGYKTLGERFAEKAIALINGKK